MTRNKLIILLSVILVLSTILFFSIKVSAEEEYFNKVELSENNFITNNIGYEFYDTIISVGLDEAGIKGVNLVVSELTSSAKDQFDSRELKAHVRYFNGTFYLFVDKYGRKEAIEVLSHEIIHISQYNSGQLIYENGELFWENEKYDLENLDYEIRPWERDAFSNQGKLYSKVYDILYNEN